LHELFQSGRPCILLTGKHPSSVLSRKAPKTGKLLPLQADLAGTFFHR
jgi:hypothetical protein